MHDMCAKFFAGDIAGAAELQRAIDPLFNCLFSEVNPIPVKAAMNMLGLKAGVMRLPLTEMEPEHAAKLRQAMIDFGLRLA
jgi:4-hydroxy-tetrahydrodipicolinate synthase